MDPGVIVNKADYLPRVIDPAGYGWQTIDFEDGDVSVGSAQPAILAHAFDEDIANDLASRVDTVGNGIETHSRKDLREHFLPRVVDEHDGGSGIEKIRSIRVSSNESRAADSPGFGIRPTGVRENREVIARVKNECVFVPGRVNRAADDRASRVDPDRIGPVSAGQQRQCRKGRGAPREIHTEGKRKGSIVVVNADDLDAVAIASNSIELDVRFPREINR